jgi:hypothetical protein
MGLRVELSTNPSSQGTTNDAQGTVASSSANSAAGAISPLGINTFVAIAGVEVKLGDTLYIHGLQLGAGATVPTNVYVYVQE